MTRTERRIPVARLLATTLVVASGGAAQAATITVDSFLDESAASAPNGTCTLREAVLSANGNLAVDGCAAGDPGLDAIVLPAGTYVLTIEGRDEEAAETGDLDVTEDLTLTGAGMGVTVVTTGRLDRVFHVGPLEGDASAKISALTLTDAYPGNGANGGAILVGAEASAVVEDVEVHGCYGTHGGAISANGDLTVRRSDLHDNHAVWAGALHVHHYTDGQVATVEDSRIAANEGGPYGGGIYARGPYPGSSTFRLVRSEVTGNGVGYNLGDGEGGGIYFGATLFGEVVDSLIANNWAIDGGPGGGIYQNLAGHDLTIVRSRITGNEATGEGGGLYSASVENDRIRIEDSWIDDNIAATDGGGLWVATKLELVRSTVSGNRAAGNGGGLYFDADVEVGGTGARGVLEAQSSTLSGNFAGENGGAVYGVFSSILGLLNTTVAENQAARGSAFWTTSPLLTMGNTIVAGRCVANATSLGGNLESPGSTCSLLNITDQRNVPDPGLGPLTPAGTSAVHGLETGSAAIDAGLDVLCPAVDQRGEPRPQGTSCDVGAVESDESGGGCNSIANGAGAATGGAARLLGLVGVAAALGHRTRRRRRA